MSDQDKIENNIWETNLDEVIAFIHAATSPDPYEPDGNTLRPDCIDWSWIKNSDCKYISLRFDMRDGAFVILNRDKTRITFEELKKQ